MPDATRAPTEIAWHTKTVFSDCSAQYPPWRDIVRLDTFSCRIFIKGEDQQIRIDKFCWSGSRLSSSQCTAASSPPPFLFPAKCVLGNAARLEPGNIKLNETSPSLTGGCEAELGRCSLRSCTPSYFRLVLTNQTIQSLPTVHEVPVNIVYTYFRDIGYVQPNHLESAMREECTKVTSSAIFPRRPAEVR